MKPVISHMFAALVSILLSAPITAQAEIIPVNDYGDWKVSVYISENQEDMSCDLTTASPTGAIIFNVEYWNDKTTRFAIHFPSLERDPFPQEMTLRLRIDNYDLFWFKDTKNYGDSIHYVGSANQTVWANFLNELAAGQYLYLVGTSGQNIEPGFRLNGSRQAIDVWKDCVRKLQH